jgi:hypothetical protein
MGGVLFNGKLTKPLSRGAQYVTLQKHFWHPSLVIHFFSNTTHKTKNLDCK